MQERVVFVTPVFPIAARPLCSFCVQTLQTSQPSSYFSLLFFCLFFLLFLSSSFSLLLGRFKVTLRSPMWRWSRPLCVLSVGFLSHCELRLYGSSSTESHFGHLGDDVSFFALSRLSRLCLLFVSRVDRRRGCARRAALALPKWSTLYSDSQISHFFFLLSDPTSNRQNGNGRLQSV